MIERNLRSQKVSRPMLLMGTFALCILASEFGYADQKKNDKKKKKADLAQVVQNIVKKVDMSNQGVSPDLPDTGIYRVVNEQSSILVARAWELFAMTAKERSIRNSARERQLCMIVNALDRLNYDNDFFARHITWRRRVSWRWGFPGQPDYPCQWILVERGSSALPALLKVICRSKDESATKLACRAIVEIGAEIEGDRRGGIAFARRYLERQHKLVKVDEQKAKIGMAIRTLSAEPEEHGTNPKKSQDKKQKGTDKSVP